MFAFIFSVILLFAMFMMAGICPPYWTWTKHLVVFVGLLAVMFIIAAFL